MARDHDRPAETPTSLLLRLLLPLLLLAALGVMIRWYGLGWGPQHRLSEPVAKLSAQLEQMLAEQAADVHDSHDAEAVALTLTDELLHFGFRHRTSLRFGEPRQGNAAEYAQLFATAFNRLATQAELAARAVVVHSEPTSLMGFAPRHPAFRSHDWVAIIEQGNKRYVDPTLHDAWLGSDVSRNVEGGLEPVRRAVVARTKAGANRPERIGNGVVLPPPPKAPKEKKTGKVAVGKIFDALGVPLPGFE